MVMEFTVQHAIFSVILVFSLIYRVSSLSPPGTPVITSFPNIVTDGDVITVSCTSTGGDPSDVTLWWRENNIIKDSTFNQIQGTSPIVTENNYTFAVTRSMYNSTFHCTARNTQDTVNSLTKSFQQVYATPGNPTLTGPSTFNVGTSQTWSCTSLGGYPVHSISWYLGGQFITGDFTNVTASGLTYDLESQVTRTIVSTDHGKQMECRVKHNETLGSNFKTTSKTLTVHSAPTVSIDPTISNVLTGNDVSVTCDVSSTLASFTVNWYKVGTNGVLTSTTDRTVNGIVLTILTASDVDGGNYYCTATNTAGTSAPSNNVLVVIYTTPTNVVSAPSSVTVNASQSFTLTCSADATPSSSLSYSWSFGGTVLSSASSLTVSDAQKSDSGTYMCVAINSFGSQSVDVLVDVQYKPQSTSSSSALSPSAPIGDNVLLSCDTDANPAVPSGSYEWYQGSTKLSVTGKENSVQAEANEQVYTCYATNSVGTSTGIDFTVTGTSTGAADPPDSGASTGDTGTGLSTGVIIAIVLGIALLLLIIIIIIVCCICSGSCRKKEKKNKKKSQITPKPQPEDYETHEERPTYVVDHTYTPRHKPRPYSYRDLNPSIISRKHVDVDMESSDGYGGYGYIHGNNNPAETNRSTTSRFVLRAPPTAVESENGTIISVYDDSRHLTSKPKHPVHLSGDHTYTVEDVRRKERRRRKKKRHHKREAAEGEESPPRRERRERDESEHRDRSHRRKEKRDGSKHRRSRRERREELEDLGEHGYISEGSPTYSQDNLVINN